MPTNEERLTPEQKELVAIGASVGAGCLPCTSFHFNLSRKIGIEAGRMGAAVADAERVVSDARDRLLAHVSEELGRDAEASAGTPRVESELAALGAAIAANSLPNIRRHMIQASECGLSGSQLAEAISVAERVQRKAAEGHIEETARFLERFGKKLAETDDLDDLCDAGCGCRTKETTDVV